MRSDAIFAVAIIGIEGGEKELKPVVEQNGGPHAKSSDSEEGGVLADGKVAPVAVAERPRHRVRRRGCERPRLLLLPPRPSASTCLEVIMMNGDVGLKSSFTVSLDLTFAL